MANTLITPERAKQLQALGVKARLENTAKLKEAAQIGQQLLETQAVISESNETFIANVLARVRKQIESVMKMMEKETDAGDIDKLARSLGTLLERERILSNRPAPGSLKPSSKPAKRSQSFAQPEPVDETPAQTGIDWSSPDAPNG